MPSSAAWRSDSASFLGVGVEVELDDHDGEPLR
jgi:hypothetical protein